MARSHNRQPIPSGSRRTVPAPESRLLAEALEAQDAAAVAFALRNDMVVVPLLPAAVGGAVGAAAGQVRVFRAPGAEKHTLLFFSSAATYARMVPQERQHRVLAYRRTELAAFLEAHLDEADVAWFDVAGPFPMQADPCELLAALRV